MTPTHQNLAAALALTCQSRARNVIRLRSDGLKASARFVEDWIIRDARKLERLLKGADHARQQKKD